MAAALIGLSHAQLGKLKQESTEESTLSYYNLDDYETYTELMEVKGVLVTENHAITFDVSSNPTTGYNWIIETKSECEQIELVQDYTTSITDEVEMMGAGGTTTLTVVGRSASRDYC